MQKTSRYTKLWSGGKLYAPPSKSIIFNWIKLNLKLNGYRFALQFLEQMLVIFAATGIQFVHRRKIYLAYVFYSVSKACLIATYTLCSPQQSYLLPASYDSYNSCREEKVTSNEL